MQILNLVGILTILVFLSVGLYLLTLHKITSVGFLFIALSSITAGISIANIEHFTSMTISKEQGLSLKILTEVKQKAVEVTAKADEVEKIKDSVNELVRDVNTTKQQIDVTGKSVSEAQKSIKVTEDNLRNSAKLFIESYYLSLGTRNIFPIPQEVGVIIDQDLNHLAEFAEPDPSKRQSWVARLTSVIKKVQEPPPPKTK